MKILIINGSPRANGDTAALLAELRKHLHGEIIEIAAYRCNIAPCVDCRACQTTSGCVVNDEMSVIYGDDYDSIVIASPVYYSVLPGPLLSIMSRFQAWRNAQYCLNSPVEPRPKKGGIILTAGGKGNEAAALRLARVFLKIVNADVGQTVVAAGTDAIPAVEDDAALNEIIKLAQWLEG